MSAVYIAFGNNQGGTAILNSSLSNDRDFFMFQNRLLKV
ncbi:hypothetical protein Pjdr2_4347 [Paenibacillus sp. JDR-2]|nr:hypothetical protein Pjdr2_4347 [Paenibacillus sp. JDR-2]